MSRIVHQCDEALFNAHGCERYPEVCAFDSDNNHIGDFCAPCIVLGCTLNLNSDEVVTLRRFYPGLHRD